MRRIALLTIATLILIAIPAAAQPVPPVRVIAEWEPALGTLISWPLGIPQALVEELAEDDMLYVLVNGSSAENQARSTFNSWGIDPAHVEYIQTSVGSHWPRDWGPHQVFDGNGDWGILDPVFEGYPWVSNACVPISSPGGYSGDDGVPADVASYFGAPLHSFPAYLTGGNFLVDGQSAGFSTCAMVGENNQLWTETEFRSLAADWLGVTDYHVVDSTEDHGIQHIDCWFKPLDEETLLVKLPPTWHEEYDRIEANLAQLASATTCYGRPYRIVRIDCPVYSGGDVAAYTNSLILNRKVLVPQFNIPADADAIATFEAAMPGYEVIGFPWGSWYYYDALHCRTRAVFDPGMLRMTHARLDDEVSPAAGHTVTTMIDDRSESGLIPGQLKVHWRLTGAPTWNEVLLSPTGTADTFEADIPGQVPGAAVEYYVGAADNSGRSETLPRTAPVGFYSFTVSDDGLTVTAMSLPTLLAPGTPMDVTVTIDPGIESLVPGSPTLHWRTDGGAFGEIPLVFEAGLDWTATLPAAACGASPEFYFSALGDVSGLKTDPAGAPASLHSAEVGVLAPETLFDESFEAGLPAGWSADGLWQITGACPVGTPPAGSSWAYYGLTASCTYDTGSQTTGALTSPPIALPVPPGGGSVTLRYFSNLETENETGYDWAGLYLDETLIDSPAETASWESRSVDLTPWAGQTVELSFRFDSVDDYYNNFHGWQVDGVVITADELECNGLTVSFQCTPSSGTLPFTSSFSVQLDNPVADQTRRIAGRIDIDLAGGGFIGNWRAGFTNIAPGASFATGWNQSLPAVPGLVGTTVFTLHGMDVTPAPYNQPPYQPAGATASDSCGITGTAP